MWDDEDPDSGEEETSPTDDQMDSEIEALLYAQVHYEPSLPLTAQKPAEDGQEQEGFFKESELVPEEKPPKKKKRKKEEKKTVKARQPHAVETIVISSDTDRPLSKYNYQKERQTFSVKVTISNEKKSTKERTVCATKKKEGRKRKKKGESSKPKKRKKKPGQVITIASSDDDIWRESESVEKLPVDIVLNVETQKRVRMVETEEESDFDLDDIRRSMTGGNWRILEDDRYKNVATRSRYFGGSAKRCRLCEKTGHLAENCPQPKKQLTCLYCGQYNHLFSKCPDTICTRCCNAGHSRYFCWISNRELEQECLLCGFIGHSKYQCPDYWRRYHLTTTVGPPVPSKFPNKPGKKIYCYNCAEKGHYGFECEQPRMQSSSYPTTPFICSYSEPVISTTNLNLKNDVHCTPEKMNGHLARRLVNSKIRFQDFLLGVETSRIDYTRGRQIFTDRTDYTRGKQIFTDRNERNRETFSIASRKRKDRSWNKTEFPDHNKKRTKKKSKPRQLEGPSCRKDKKGKRKKVNNDPPVFNGKSKGKYYKLRAQQKMKRNALKASKKLDSDYSRRRFSNR